jgi:hypothetical protein
MQEPFTSTGLAASLDNGEGSYFSFTYKMSFPVRTLLLLCAALVFAGAATATESTGLVVSNDFVVSKNTVSLRVEATTTAEFDPLVWGDLLVARGELQDQIEQADAASDAMVDRSYDSDPDEQWFQQKNRDAVEHRRAWAKGIDGILQQLRAGAELKLSVVFPDGDEKRRLLELKDWREVKKQIAAAGKDDEMKALLKYRRRLTDALLAVAWLRMRQELPPEADNTAAKQYDFNETEPVGSVTRTSDLDVTTVGYRCSAAVKHFNQDFRGGFCLESGIVLDSNVYCEIFKVHDAVPALIQGIRDSENKKPQCQDAMALAKLRRYMSEPDWKRFASEVKAAESVTKAAALYGLYESKLTAKLGKSPAICEKQHASPSSCKQEITCTENGVMQASNDLYAASLNLLEEDLRKDPGQVDKIKFEQSSANLFANESYNSQGPLLHILGVMQLMGKNDQLSANLRERLTKNQLLDSLNEQVGDALKDLKHYQQTDPATAFGEALYKSAKYVERAVDAVTTLQGRGLVGATDEQPLIMQTFSNGGGYDLKTLLQIRKGKDPYKISDSGKASAATKSSPTFTGYDVLRQKLVDAVIDINRRVRGSDPDASCDLEVALQ